MTNNKTAAADLEKLSRLPENGGGTSAPPVSDSDDEKVRGTSEPSKAKYYKSLSRLLDFIKWFIPPVIAIGLFILGYYFYQVREPVIRLEENFTNLEKSVEKNYSSIEEIKKAIYSNQNSGNPPTEVKKD